MEDDEMDDDGQIEMFDDAESASIESDDDVGSLESFVQKKFTRAKTSRLYDENRWLHSYRNYRGLYGPDMVWRDSEKSRIFVKITKTKVLAAYGQIVEVLFGNNKFPITVDPTTLPEGVAESVFFESNPELVK